MPRATSENTTPELREVAFVRAIPPTPITFNQPLRGGRYRAISGRLLGETQFDGVLHHFRIEAGGVLLLVPPDWIEVDAPAILSSRKVCDLPTATTFTSTGNGREKVCQNGEATSQSEPVRAEVFA